MCSISCTPRTVSCKILFNHHHHQYSTFVNVTEGMAKTSLFVGDLSIFCKEADLHDMFAPFGEILEIKIMRNEHTSQNLSYGFLKYSNPLSAKRAMTELNQVVLCGRPMRWVV